MTDESTTIPYVRHVFVCTNKRPDGAPRGSCSAKGAEALRERLKAEVKANGLSETVRINAAGCLDFCEQGPTVCVYPENVWYGGVAPADAEEIVSRHLIDGVFVARLAIPPEVLARAD